jgi:CheY-like chemotaxis protein
LVVDDESMIVTLLRNALPDMPVEGFEQPEQALVRAREQTFDVVFCDLVMPGMTGIELYEELVQMGKSPDTFVLMTGFGVDEDLKAYVESHGLSLLKKPFRLRELLELVPIGERTGVIER